MKSLNSNVLEDVKDSEIYSNAKKKAAAVENSGNDFYMVRSVINGDGKIAGSSVSVLSKETIGSTKGQVSRVSLENRRNKSFKSKHFQSRSQYKNKLDETTSPLMDEPKKGKYINI